LKMVHRNAKIFGEDAVPKNVAIREGKDGSLGNYAMTNTSRWSAGILLFLN